MAWLYKEWDNRKTAGVSGWDPFAPLVFWLEIVFISGAVISIYQSFWALAVLFSAMAVLHPATARYSLVIHPSGYQLWRYCFYLVPWRLQRYSKDAIVWIEDDWGVNVGLVIFGEDEDITQGTVFGNSHDCAQASRRIHDLAFQMGLVDSPPQTDPNSESMVSKFAVPCKPRRMKYFSRRKFTNESK